MAALAVCVLGHVASCIRLAAFTWSGAAARRSVDPSIVSIGYDVSSETLEVEFKADTVYQYLTVPQFMWERLMGADSIDRFFSLEI
jgi:hypothetical protein